MMPPTRLIRLIAAVALCLFTLTAAAQNQTLLILDTANRQMQTGQYYDVMIRIDGAPDIWLTSFEVSYDPLHMYIAGTKAGAPLKQGPFFDPALSVVVQNVVNNNRIKYTVSMLAPAKLISGSGVVGILRVYPLTAGKTQLLFSKASIGTVTFVDQNGQRMATNPREVPFSPVLLDLTITGNTVPAPPEPTATPLPTETPAPTVGPGGSAPTLEPTLVNVTLDPNATRAPVTPLTERAATSALLPIAIAVMVIAGLGLIVLLLVWRRSRRR